jgi:hypothetical protein
MDFGILCLCNGESCPGRLRKATEGHESHKVEVFEFTDATQARPSAGVGLLLGVDPIFTPEFLAVCYEDQIPIVVPSFVTARLAIPKDVRTALIYEPRLRRPGMEASAIEICAHVHAARGTLEPGAYYLNGSVPIRAPQD